jgi:hypothetical protein
MSLMYVSIVLRILFSRMKKESRKSLNTELYHPSFSYCACKDSANEWNGQEKKNFFSCMEAGDAYLLPIEGMA